MRRRGSQNLSEGRVDTALVELMARVFLGLIVVGALGCSRGGQSRPAPVKTYPVRGTVTFQGKPLPDATVLFRSKDGKWTASGRTDSNGTFTLTTFNPGDGAPAGEYMVAVMAFEAPATSESEEKPGPPPKMLIPKKYATPETSGLTATVGEKENEVKLTLE
ncbi:MAG: carboxypeptidase-like regulatory domain-containing protein [Thermoguttaceae bacterium]|nr:carboxypeptidase-like regulatory domain-containing protein [Thermoguttaceae bacterium]MDW8079442.1 hypothetical protein [Thermoguttaceae bacterium]